MEDNSESGTESRESGNLMLASLQRVLLAGVGTFAAAAAAFILYGIAKVLYDPAVHAYLGDTVPYSERGRATAALELSWSSAWLLGVPASGFLIERFGLRNVLRIGVLFGFACVAVNLGGTSVWHFWAALFLLGLSWNFLFIGATSLLTQTYTQAEKARTQASNDFAVFTTVTLSSLSAGALQHKLGWEMVNLGVLPLLAIVWVAIVALGNIDRNNRHESDPGAGPDPK